MKNISNINAFGEIEAIIQIYGLVFGSTISLVHFKAVCAGRPPPSRTEPQQIPVADHLVVSTNSLVRANRKFSHKSASVRYKNGISGRVVLVSNIHYQKRWNRPGMVYGSLECDVLVSRKQKDTPIGDERNSLGIGWLWNKVKVYQTNNHDAYKFQFPDGVGWCSIARDGGGETTICVECRTLLRQDEC